MTRSRRQKIGSSWRFRREVTFGNLLHLAVLAVLAITAWTNLQKELVGIRYDLNQLVMGNRTLHEHIVTVTDLCRDHEYRLVALEKQTDTVGITPANEKGDLLCVTGK